MPTCATPRQDLPSTSKVRRGRWRISRSMETNGRPLRSASTQGTSVVTVETARRSPKSRHAFYQAHPRPRPVTVVITFSDVRWTTISYRRGIAAYRALSLARTSRILFLGCGFAPGTLLGNWTWSGHAGSALAAHLLPLLYLWVAKFTKRCGPRAERLPCNAPVPTTSFDVTRFRTERRIGTSPVIRVY